MNAAIIESVAEPDAKLIRAGIRRAEEARRRAEAARDRATEELLDWVEAARRSPGITVEEAAELAGVTRARLYQMLRERQPKD